MSDPEAVVSPGGVGFDINCGVRLLRTNLTEKDVAPVKEKLTQSLFDHIPVGVGSKGIIPTTAKDLEAALVSTLVQGSKLPLHSMFVAHSWLTRLLVWLACVAGAWHGLVCARGLLLD